MPAETKDRQAQRPQLHGKTSRSFLPARRQRLIDADGERDHAGIPEDRIVHRPHFRADVQAFAAGAVDADAERAKAQKELTDTQRYVSALNQQLANQEFTSKAPASVVEGMKAKREIAEVALKALEMKIKKG